MKGISYRGNRICFGRYALQALEPAWITSRQIEKAGRRAMTRNVRRDGKIWVRIFPDKPVTVRPTETPTGFAMTFYYRPTVTEAFASVQYIMAEANFGWLIRSVHRWSASVVLAVLTASFSVTGYSLPRDQIGYWAVKIVTGVPEAIPVIGSPLVELLRGSASVGQSTLTRFYSLHTFVLPLLTAVFMLMHFLMIRKQGISGPL
ncbi:hypothetical protein V6N13_061804 [Hibiscus sabdariffa]